MAHQRGKTTQIIVMIIYASRKRETEDEIDEKIYKEQKLETAIEFEKQAIEDEKKLSKVNQNRTRFMFKLQKNQILKEYKTFLKKSKIKNQ